MQEKFKRKENLPSCVGVLHNTSYWEVSRRSRAVDVKERYLKSVMNVQSGCFPHKTNCFFCFCFFTLSLLSSSSSS